MPATPYWLKKRIVVSGSFFKTRDVLKKCGVRTVCASSLCPNMNECFASKKATFLIMGSRCTRNCRFCAVEKGVPGAIDEDEAYRVLRAVMRLGIGYAIITSVTRDDLPDGGASRFVDVVKAIKECSQGVKIELLVPDFNGNKAAVETAARAGGHVFGHNMETVRRLYPIVRPEGNYDRSLDALSYAKRAFPEQVTKSGLMLGLGETAEEVLKAMEDIRKAGCDIITIGQYLRPGITSMPVDRFVPPEEFALYREAGIGMGFVHISSGPFVRSSYMAEIAYRKAKDELTKKLRNEKTGKQNQEAMFLRS